jgi:hypothetical protein
VPLLNSTRAPAAAADIQALSALRWKTVGGQR